MDGSLTNFLSRPFVTQEEITKLSQTQEMLRDDTKVRGMLGQCLAFLNFLTKDLRESISPLVQSGILQRHDENVKKINSLQAIGVAMDFVSRVHAIQQALTLFIQSKTSEEGSFPPMFQSLFANFSVFLEKVKQIANQIRIYPAKKFLFIQRSSISFDYQRAGEERRDLGSVANLCNLSEDLRSLNIEQQAFSYWLRVFCAMAKFQGKCKDWLTEAELQEAVETDGGETSGVGRFAVEGLYHPIMAYKGENDRGESPVPQERLVFDPQHKIIVFAGVNGGGKTKLVQAITWAHILRQVGSSVLGKEGSEVPMVSGILTHQSRDTGFEKRKKGAGEEDDIDHSKWAEELRELRRLCDQVKPGTLAVIDEMLLATGQLGVEKYAREIIDEFVAKGARVLFVTHNAELIHSLAAQANCLVFEAGVEGGKPTYQFRQCTVDTLTPSGDYAARREAIFNEIWRKRSETPSA